MKPFALLDRPIAFHRCFVDLTGSVTAALMLSQAVYWQRCNKDGVWWFQTQEKWQREIGLTRREQETARKALRALPFWREKLLGIPGKLHFFVDLECLLDHISNSQASMADSAIQERTDAPFMGEQISHSCREVSRNQEVGITQEPKVGNGSDETAAQVGISPLFQDMDSEKLDPKNQPPPEAPKVETPPPKAPRQRNVLADALATLNGESLDEVTKDSWGCVMGALKDIKAVCPDVTVDEIKRRRCRYLQRHPGWELTPKALAKYWASLSDSVKKPTVPKTGIPNIHTYKPPTNG
mgnify:FL=1